MVLEIYSSSSDCFFEVINLFLTPISARSWSGDAHIGHILRREHVVVIVQNGVSRNIFVGVIAKEDTDGRVISLSPFKLVVHSAHTYPFDRRPDDVFLKSSVYQNVTFQIYVIENEVDIVILFLGMDMLLTGNKRKTLYQAQAGNFFKLSIGIRSKWLS